MFHRLNPWLLRDRSARADSFLRLPALFFRRIAPPPLQHLPLPRNRLQLLRRDLRENIRPGGRGWRLDVSGLVRPGGDRGESDAAWMADGFGAGTRMPPVQGRRCPFALFTCTASSGHANMPPTIRANTPPTIRWSTILLSNVDVSHTIHFARSGLRGARRIPCYVDGKRIRCWCADASYHPLIKRHFFSRN